jgi:hypothetical protein
MIPRTRAVEVSYGHIRSEMLKISDASLKTTLYNAFSHKYKKLNLSDWVISKIDYEVWHTELCAGITIQAIFTSTDTTEGA